jgi:hypothetical protein
MGTREHNTIATNSNMMLLKQIMKNRLMMVYFGKPLANTNEYSSASGAYNFKDENVEFTMELLLQELGIYRTSYSSQTC